MKINRAKHAGEEGSVFVIAICVVALFALVLGSYITLVHGQATSVARSQSYNSAIPVAEAGVEEAFALINRDGGASTWTNSLTSDGWSSLTSSNTTTKSNLVLNGSYYQVIISNPPGGYPTITSAGVVPFIEYPWGAQMVTNSATNSTSTVGLTRTIQIQTTRIAASGGAVLAKQSIDFTGGALIDSFNSANTSLSSNGQYSASKRDDQAIVATDGTISSSIFGSGGVTIRGSVNTGPNGTMATSGGVSIGDMNWVNGGTNGVEPSRSNDDFNVTFADVSIPSATFVETPSNGVVSGTNYTMVFRGNQYWGTSNVMYESSINIQGGQSAVVTNGSVILYVPAGDTFNFSGSGFIYVSPGSSITIYCGASTAGLSGSALVGATNAENVTFYGLPTCTTINYSGGSAFVGTIYAPEAAFTGSGSDVIIGALMANSFLFSGSATVHYDENLGNTNFTGYVANSWQEIAAPTALLNLAP